MNSKGFEMPISTLIVIILGVLVLVALIVGFTGGFDRFFDSTDPYLDTAEVSAFVQACGLSCRGENYLSYCCSQLEFNNRNISCMDSGLKLDCSLDCSATSCLV